MRAALLQRDGVKVFDVAHRCFVRFPGGCSGTAITWSRGVRLKESALWLCAQAQSWTTVNCQIRLVRAELR